MQAHATASLGVGGDAFFGDSVFPQALAALENPGGTPTGSRPPFWNYDQQWMIGRWFDNRTSLIIDPPNGRMPPLTPEAMQRAERQRAARDASSPMRRQTISEELASLDPGVVCRGGRILMCGRGYNSNYQILKTADYVAIQMEMMHDTRLIPIGAEASRQVVPRQDLGNSRGRWDGDTPVAETTNLSQGISGSSRDVRLTERSTRVGQARLQYEYTVTNPSTWTQSWTARVFTRPTPGTGAIYEFVCREGNCAAELTLRSTRGDDAAKGQ